MRSKVFIFKFLTLVFSLPAFSQYLEIGAFGGGSHFVGDVGNHSLHLPQGYAVGGLVKYNFNRHWALRVQVNYGTLAADDSEAQEDFRLNRNLQFQSDILEGALMLEFNFLEYEPGTKKNQTPYLLGGFGIFKFNPKAEFDGELHELQPLGTEGQGSSGTSASPYAMGSSFFAFGLGYKWAIGNVTTIGIESTFRRTYTDYLDDVSGQYGDPFAIENAHGDVAAALSDRSLTQTPKVDAYRGNPNNDDWYVFTGVTLQFKFGELYEKCSSFIRR